MVFDAGGLTPSGASRFSWGRFAFLLAFSHFAAWMLFLGSETLSKPGEFFAAAEVQLALTDDFSEVDSAVTLRVPLEPEPAYRYKHPRGPLTKAYYLFDFEVDEVAGDQALWMGWMRAVYEIRLNGQILKPESHADRWGMLGGFEPDLFVLPATDLLTGPNRLAFLSGGQSSKILPAFYVGPLSDLSRAHRWAQAFSVDLVLVAIGVMVFVALICLAVRWPPAERLHIYALAILLLLWSARNLLFFQVDFALPAHIVRPLHFCVSYLFAGSWIGLGLTYGSFPRRWLSLLVGALLALVVGTFALYSLLDPAQAWPIAFAIETALIIGACFGFIVSICYVHVTATHAIFGASLLYLVCAWVVMIDAIDDRWPIHVPLNSDLPLTFYLAPSTGLLLGLVMLIVLIRRLTQARLVVDSANRQLQLSLQDREAKLEKQFQLREETEKQLVRVEERRRIMRDMHDGLGGRLMTIAAQASDPDVPRTALASEASAGLDELRLIVDSMDTEGDSLAVALGAFRTRIEPLVRRANMAFEWRVDDAVEDTYPDGRLVLAVFRILQEGCRNAIEHSEATLLSVSVNAGKGVLTVAISDNGVGIADTQPRGQGFKSMLERAQALGGNLDVETGAQGTKVRLVIPMPH